MLPQHYNVSTMFTKLQGQSPILVTKPSTAPICSAADRTHGWLNSQHKNAVIKKAITIEIRDISEDFQS